VTLTARQQEIKTNFIRVRGAWSDTWEGVLRLDPEFLAAYLELSAVPWRKNHLDDKVKEFIYIAIDAATTHLYEPGLRIHIRNALKYGATKEEIMEVYQLTSVLGMHTCTMGVPVLIDELAKAGQPVLDLPECIKKKRNTIEHSNTATRTRRVDPGPDHGWNRCCGG